MNSDFFSPTLNIAPLEQNLYCASKPNFTSATVDNKHQQPAPLTLSSIQILLILHLCSSEWSWVRWQWSLAGSLHFGRRCRRRSGSSGSWRRRRQRQGFSRRGKPARTCSSRCCVSGSRENKHLFPFMLPCSSVCGTPLWCSQIIDLSVSTKCNIIFRRNTTYRHIEKLFFFYCVYEKPVWGASCINLE